MDDQRSEQTDALKGVAAGLVAGAAATVVMTGFQMLWKSVSRRLSDSSGGRRKRRGRRRQKSQNPTVTVASEIAQNVFNTKLKSDSRERAGEAVHFGFGTLMGGLYGVASELAPVVTTGMGSLYGAGVFVGADETALPLIGLAEAPTDVPLKTHVYALASHLVYGLSAELVRRTVRPLL